MLTSPQNSPADATSGDEPQRLARNLAATQARIAADGLACWVEICFCNTPLEEERPYWENYFDLVDVRDAHNRKNCRDENGSEPWACMDCDCTERLEQHLAKSGGSFLLHLRTTNLEDESPRSQENDAEDR